MTMMTTMMMTTTDDDDDGRATVTKGDECNDNGAECDDDDA